MINFELTPSTLLGIILLIVAIVLYFIRICLPSISRDYDLIFSSMGLLCGGILIFQGWRLDPILLFSQILSNIIAMFFIWEAIRLRKENIDKFCEIRTQNRIFQRYYNKQITFLLKDKKKQENKIIIERIPYLSNKIKRYYYYNPLDFYLID